MYQIMSSIYKSKSKKLKMLTRNLYTDIYSSLFFPQSPETGNNTALQAEKGRTSRGTSTQWTSTQRQKEPRTDTQSNKDES